MLSLAISSPHLHFPLNSAEEIVVNSGEAKSAISADVVSYFPVDSDFSPPTSASAFVLFPTKSFFPLEQVGEHCSLVHSGTGAGDIGT